MAAGGGRGAEGGGGGGRGGVQWRWKVHGGDINFDHVSILETSGAPNKHIGPI